MHLKWECQNVYIELNMMKGEYLYLSENGMILIDTR